MLVFCLATCFKTIWKFSSGGGGGGNFSNSRGGAQPRFLVASMVKVKEFLYNGAMALPCQWLPTTMLLTFIFVHGRRTAKINHTTQYDYMAFYSTERFSQFMTAKKNSKC